jgi:hypothetical protein
VDIEVVVARGEVEIEAVVWYLKQGPWQVWTMPLRSCHQRFKLRVRRSCSLASDICLEL